MSEEKIACVSDNQEKRDTYTSIFGRYKAAMRGKFYLEAIFIAYAVMEDRLTRFLYHTGLISDTPKLRRSKGKAAHLVKQLSPEKGNIKNISYRIQMLKNLSKWAQETERVTLDSKYEIALIDQINGNVDLGELDEILDVIQEWIKGRNECVHALMRKNAMAAEQKVESLAFESEEIIRRLDSLEKGIKKRNTLRKRFNIQ